MCPCNYIIFYTSYLRREGEPDGSFVGVIIGFIPRSFKGLFLIKSLVSAQPIKGGIFRGFAAMLGAGSQYSNK